MFKNLYKINLVLYLIVSLSLVTNIAFADENTDKPLTSHNNTVVLPKVEQRYNDSSFIRNKIYSLVGTALSGYKGHTLSEEQKNKARYYFRLNKDEEILYLYILCVITDSSIIIDDKKTNKCIALPWRNFESCEYKDNCLYFTNNINEKTIPIHLSYFTGISSNTYYVGKEIAKVFTAIFQHFRETKIQEIKTFEKINYLANNKDELKNLIKKLDENSWIYHYAKIILINDGKNKEFLQEWYGMLNTCKTNFEFAITAYLVFLNDYELKSYETARKALFTIVNDKCEYIIKNIYDVDVSEIIKETFYDVPYNKRKIIMPIQKQYISYNTKTFEMVDIDNLPENMIFPQGHPIEGELYVGHPYLPNKYFPMENHELEFTQDKIREFCYFVEMLGATEVSVESISYTDESGRRHTEKVYGGNIEYLGYGVGGEYGTSNSMEFEKKLRTIVKEHKTFRPNKKPELAKNLYWYYKEPSWQQLYESRMRGNIISNDQEISTGQSSMVQESEDKNINGEIKILAATLGGKYSKLENREYHQNKDVEISLHVIFAPREELEQFEEKK